MMKSTKNCDQSLHFISPLSRDLFMRVLDDSQSIWRYYFFQDDNCSFDVDAPNFELVPSTLNLVYDSFVRLMASSSLNSCSTSIPPTNSAAVNVSSSSSAVAANVSSTSSADNVALASTVTDTEASRHIFDDTLNAPTTTAIDINDPYQLCFNYDIVRLLHDKFIDDSDKSVDKTVDRTDSRINGDDDCATSVVSGAIAQDSDVTSPSRSIVVSSSYVVTPQRLCDSLGRYYGFVETKVKYLSTTFLHEYIVYTNVLKDFYTPDTPVRLSSDSMGSLFLSSYSNQQYPTILPLINPFLKNPDCERYDSTAATDAATLDDVSSLRSNRDSDISQFNDDCFRSQRPLVALKMLNLFQTLYRFRLDARLSDHSNHYDESFVPFFRFPYDASSSASSNSSSTSSRPLTYNRLNALSFASMSRFVGGTMRKNIRLLYDYIWEIVGSSESREFCPCVIIYNIFIRDYFRIFHSRSLSPTNYVLLYDDFTEESGLNATGGNCESLDVGVFKTNSKKIRKISYVQLSNKFPRVSQWFRSINNQFVKKNGFSRIFKLSDYVELFETALDLSLDNFVNTCATVISNTEDSTRAKSPRRSQRGKNVNCGVGGGGGNGGGGGGGVGGRRRCRLSASSSSPRSTCRLKKSTVYDRKNGVKKIGIKNFSVINALNNARRKIGVCNMMRIVDCQAMLSELYRSGYKICPHAKTRRVYIQKRSHDESASAVIFCENCKNFL